MARHWLKVEDVAERLGVSLRTVYRLVANGELEAMRIQRAIRIDAATVEAWIADHVGLLDMGRLRVVLDQRLGPDPVRYVAHRPCLARIDHRDSLEEVVPGPHVRARRDRPG